MSEPAVTARNISVTFARRGTSRRLRRGGEREPEQVHALRDVSFEVRHGEAFGIIGPNGAGKSTLMRVLGQTLTPDAGEIAVRGATSTLLQLGVGFNTQLDGSRNIVLGLLATGMPMKRIEEIHDDIWEYSELGDALYRPLSTYSRGMQSRLAFAIATFIDADILLVDEVLAVGDESFKQKSLATMREVLENAGTIVMVSHALGTVQEFCDRVMWLEEGAIQQIGDPTAVVGAYRDKHTLGNVRLVRAARTEVDQEARPLEVRRPDPLDVDLLRKHRLESDPRPYVDLAPPHPAKAAPRRARKLLDRGWKLAKAHRISITPPIEWPPPLDSDAYRALMAWDPVATLLMANARVADRRWIATAAEFAVEWSRHVPSIDRSPAWEPVVTARRAGRLGALVDLAARDPLLGDDTLRELTVLAQLHAWALEDDDRYRRADLAGLQQIAASVALTQRIPELPGSERLAGTAKRRLDEFLDDGLANDGTWTHHTPSFHAAATEQLTAMLDAGVVTDSRFEKARNKAERALAWFVMPDGSLPGFGETTPFVASQWLAGAEKPSLGRIKRRWRTGAMRGAASAGKGGAVPTETTALFPHGGYAIVRNRWPERPADESAAYLAMMAGRHSTLGKHADDLSIVWFDRGRHLLIDSGSYTGNDDGQRQYVSTARAHNTIEIDGADRFPGGEPYGGGATHAGELGTLRYAAGRALFGDDLVFRRLAVFDPGRWLLLVDLLRDRTDQPHTFRQWFHPAPDLTVKAVDGDVLVTGEDVDVYVTSLTGASLVGPIRGDIEPRQGWISPSRGVVEPAWAFGWEHAPITLGGFATLLSLEGAPHDASVDLGGAHHAHVRFRVGESLVELPIDLRDDPPFRLD